MTKPTEQEPVQEVTFGQEAHSQLLEGAEILYKAVKSTMGPSGHNVIIDNGKTAPLITKDGVTVAKSINLRSKLPSLGAELIKEIASKTNEQAGDGTTTATVLGYAMLKQGIKMTATGRSAIEIKRGMDWATKKVIGWLAEHAIPVRNDEDIINIGTISANGDRSIGELLCNAISKVGQDGIITIEPAKSVKTSLDVVEGMQFDSGFVSPYFVTNQEKMTAELNDPYILITNKKLSSLQEILPVLELAANANKPLLIIGDEIEGEALHTLIVNKMKGVLFTCAVKAPSYGENRTDVLSDIALVTGGKVFDASSEKSIKNANLSDLGQCKRAIISKGSTTLVGDDTGSRKSLISERVEQLRSLLVANVGLDDLKLANTKKRLAKLAGGIAVIKVGGSTEVEIFEKKDRVEDALNATIAAVQEGILPGGGTALFYASEWLQKEITSNEFATEDEVAGAKVIYEACRQPLRVIVENTGKSSDVVMNQLRSYDSKKLVSLLHDIAGDTNRPEDIVEKKAEVLLSQRLRQGYDASRHVYCDLIEQGIIDPHKVERYAIEHACSVVGLLLTTNCVVVINNEG